MPCALDLCEFYAQHCYDVATNKEKDWTNDQAVKDLSAGLKLAPSLLVGQMLKSVFEDPQCQFLIRVWYGPATSPEAL
jgi:hypothetical protein